MELKELIEKAEKAAGSQKALGLKIGINPSNLRNAKAGQQGLPNYACVMIADMIGEERITVIAASELVTEKKEERRKVWHPFVARAATVLLGAVTLNTISPAPANAATALVEADHCILCQIAERQKEPLPVPLESMITNNENQPWMRQNSRTSCRVRSTPAGLSTNQPGDLPPLSCRPQPHCCKSMRMAGVITSSQWQAELDTMQNAPVANAVKVN